VVIVDWAPKYVCASSLEPEIRERPRDLVVKDAAYMTPRVCHVA